MFTSDTHFGHFNVLAYSKRPFASIEEHDEALIQNWNSVVAPTDTIYHLGDFSLGSREHATKVLQRLNGCKILILGNHDRSAKAMVEMGFQEAHRSLLTKIDGKTVYMAHIPLHKDWYLSKRYNPKHTPEPPKYYDFWLCGHVHEKWRSIGKIINVGVDVFDYRPVSFSEVISSLSCKTPVGEHNVRSS